MNVATAGLHLGSDEEGRDYQEDNMRIRSGNLDLTLQDYASNAQEVSSGKFDAAFTKKYATPNSSCMLCGMQQGLQWEPWLFAWTSSRKS